MFGSYRFSLVCRVHLIIGDLKWNWGELVSIRKTQNKLSEIKPFLNYKWSSVLPILCGGKFLLVKRRASSYPVTLGSSIFAITFWDWPWGKHFFLSLYVSHYLLIDATSKHRPLIAYCLLVCDRVCIIIISIVMLWWWLGGVCFSFTL